MDFNRVHASGTSKILRKGESYTAAATLKAVDLEDHWSWADGATKFLDATCLVYDCSHKHVGHLDYQKTSMTVANGRPITRGVLSHSGDQLDDAKQSGFHQIHVQLDGLPSNVQYLYITVSAWDGLNYATFSSHLSGFWRAVLANSADMMSKVPMATKLRFSCVSYIAAQRGPHRRFPAGL